MRPIFLAWLCVLVAVPVAVAQDDAVDLRPNFVEGRTARYEFWSRRDESTTTRMAGNERRMDVRYTFSGELTWRVAAVRGDGSADCTMTFEWFTIEITANDQTRTADSRKGSSDWEGGQEFAKALTGKPLTVRVAADGSIERVDGVQAIRSQISGDDENKPDETDFKENAAGLAAIWGAPASLAVGGSWPATFAWNHEMGTLNYRTRFTLNDTGEVAGVPVAMVSSTSQLVMDFDPLDLPPEAPPVTMKFDGGEEHEQIIFDLSRHEVVARNMTQTLKATQSIRLEQGTLTQVREDTVQGQVVRVSEQ